VKLGSIVGCLLAVERGLSRLASRKLSAILLVGLISLAGRALLLPVLPIPKPAIQDEFSYLLASDTFASGRLANPPHPFPEHFETLQVLFHPTYASKYPPLSGLMMALGQKLTGEPWIGVWLSTGLLCSAICWALQGWLPPAWALLGSLIALVRIGLVSYWTESYWGGACAAIGGALVIGAVPRLIERLGPLPAIAFASGLAILANTRPNEGLIISLACSGFLAVALVRRGVGLRPVVKKALLPMALVLAPIFMSMAYYNYRVTGNALEMPYIAHENQYAVLSPLLWKVHASPAPAYSNSFLREFWLVADRGEKEREHQHILGTHVSDLRELCRFFLGWPLVLCIVGFARPLWRDSTARSVLLIAAAFYVGAALDGRLYPHYASPATALFYILAASALRVMRNAWPGGFAERIYVTWAVLAIFTLSSGLALLTAENRYLFGPIDYHIRAKHATVAARLQREPGNHLVLVHYGTHHEIYEELVYNRADIDRSKIVWARSLGSEKDQRLVQYYAGRQVWSLEEDGDVKLSRYLLPASSIPARLTSSN
jgi:hypothetical protein